MKELRKKLADLMDKYDERKQALEAEKKDGTPEAVAELNGILDEVETLEQRIKVAEREDRARGFANQSVEPPILPEPGDARSGITNVQDRPNPFRSVGEMLNRMANVARGKITDHRFDNCRISQNEFDFPVDAMFEQRGKVAGYRREHRAATAGLVESVGATGGLLVGTDIDNTLNQITWDNSQILPLLDNRTISAASNSQKIFSVYETSRADGSRQGGVRVYTDAELGSVTASKPKFSEIELKLNKLTGLCYASEEELEDIPWMDGKIFDLFANEFVFKKQDLVFNGTGAGEAQGILNAPAFVGQAKESGQAAATVVLKNINKMWARALGIRSRMVWVINAEVLPQLEELTIVGGTASTPVFVPPNGAADAPLGRLKGRPIIEIEQAAALGTVGDIMLIDPFMYMTASKGGIKSAVSIHVEFIYGNVTFRFIERFDGKPKVISAITPYKGSATRTPFLGIATRS